MSFGYLVSSKMQKDIKAYDYDHTLNQTFIDMSQEEKEDFSISRTNQINNTFENNLRQKASKINYGFDLCLMDKEYTDLIINATINKLCQEYEVFLSKKSPVLQNLDGKIHTLEKFIQQQTTQGETKNFINSTYTNFILKLSSQFLIVILTLLLTMVFGLFFGLNFWFAIFGRVKWIEKFTFFFFGLSLISVSGFFYLCTIFILNQKLSGILYDATIVGFIEIFFTSFYFVIYTGIQNMNYQYSNEFKQLIVSPNLLYFELIDRQNFSAFLQNQMEFNDSYQILKLIPKQINKLIVNAQAKILQNKVWNSGYLLLYNFSSSVKSKSKSRNYTNIVILVAGLLVLTFVIPLFVYLCLDLDNIKTMYILLKITFFVLILASKTINWLVHILIIIKEDDFYDQIASQTTLLEINNQSENSKIQKNFSAINIFCIQSIQTWWQMREITLGFVKKYFLNINFIYTLDIIIIIIYTTALIVDYKGIIWQKNQIIGSQFLLCYILFSIIQRVLVSLVIIFNQFSGINKFLKYNKDQFYKILQKLIYFKQTYLLLRQSTYEEITSIIQKNDIQLFDFKRLSQFENSLNQVKNQNFRNNTSEKLDVNEAIRDDMKRQSIIEMKSICEIKRNANYYLKEDKIDINQNHLTEIQLEEKYLDNLIDVYKNLIDNMKEHENDNTIKFLGIIPLVYARFYAFLTLLVPALASYFIKQFINF